MRSAFACLRFFALLVAMPIAAVPAQAVLLDYAIQVDFDAGPVNSRFFDVRFSLDNQSRPDLIETDPGNSSIFFNTLFGTVNGADATIYMRFFDADSGGGFDIAFLDFLASLITPQLFTDLANPTLLTGTYLDAPDFFDARISGDVRITAAAAAAVPEPAVWAMMIGGFGLAGATLRRRRSSARAGTTVAAA